VPGNPQFCYGSGSMKHRRKRRIPFAAYAALIFNGALCATPFMAAHLISQAYGDKRPAFQTTPEAITATRQAMDDRFEAISLTEDAAPRDVWSDLVRTALEEREMARVRGLLLSASAMLDGKDGEALRARIAVADGGGDDAMLQAALAYLPYDVQDAYERQTKSIVSMFSASAPASALPSASPALARIEPELEASSAMATVLIEDEIEPRVATNRLGDLRQHTLAAVGWANDDNTDIPAFVLSGIGLILADPEAREGASVAMSTLRTRTQAPVPFKLYLTKRIEEIVPVAEVKRLLSAELGAPFAALFVIIHGAGNGLLTITRGTLPLALFGPVGYGQRQGFITAPARASQAFAPLLFGLLLDDFGAASLWLTALLGVAAVAALFMMRVRQ
jgi:hypothetical protein